MHGRIEMCTLLRNSLPERLQLFPHAPLLPCGFSTSQDARYAAIVITDGEFVVALEIGLPRRAHAIWREIAESVATCELARSARASRKNASDSSTRRDSPPTFAWARIPLRCACALLPVASTLVAPRHVLTRRELRLHRLVEHDPAEIILESDRRRIDRRRGLRWRHVGVRWRVLACQQPIPKTEQLVRCELGELARRDRCDDRRHLRLRGAVLAHRCQLRRALCGKAEPALARARCRGRREHRPPHRRTVAPRTTPEIRCRRSRAATRVSAG